MIKDVVEVRPLGGHRLYLKYDDGVHGEVDVAQFVRFDGVFEELRDPARFAEVRVDPDLGTRSEEHTSELQSHSDLVCRLLLEKKKNTNETAAYDVGLRQR